MSEKKSLKRSGERLDSKPEFQVRLSAETLSAQISQMEAALEIYEKAAANLPSEEVPRPSLNHPLKQNRYDYGALRRAEEAAKPKKAISKPSINKNWLAANLKEPDMTPFLQLLFSRDDEEVNAPLGSFSDSELREVTIPSELHFDFEQWLEDVMVAEKFID